MYSDTITSSGSRTERYVFRFIRAIHENRLKSIAVAMECLLVYLIVTKDILPIKNGQLRD